MTTILVTGGCGFIGSQFVRLVLKETDFRVINLDKLSYAGSQDRVRDLEEDSRYRLVIGDMADRELIDALLTTEAPRMIVNLAAESHVDRSILDATPFLHSNVVGVHTLLDAARRYKTDRFVHVSTDEVYGDSLEAAPSSETSPLRPSSPYAATKAAADLLCLSYHRTYGVAVLITRPCNTYGPFQFPEKLIPLMIRNAMRGEELPLYGDGLQQRDWLYVEDTCRAILAVLTRGREGATYNVGSDNPMTNLAVVKAICALLAEETGRDAGTFLQHLRFVADRPGHDRLYRLESSRMNTEIGWFPAVPFAQGLRQTVRWYIDNKQWWEKAESEEFRQYRQAVYGQQWGTR